MVTRTNQNKVKKRKGMTKFTHGVSKTLKSTGKFVSEEIDQTNKAFTGILGSFSNPVVMVALIGAAVILVPKIL